MVGRIGCCCLGGSDVAPCWRGLGLPVAGEIWLVELGLNGWISAAVNVLIRVAIPFSMVSVSGMIWDCWLERSGVTSC